MKPLPTIIILLLWPFISQAQVPPKARLSGRMLDAATHKPIAGASVSLILAKDSSRTPYTTITDDRGQYRMVSVNPGDYKVYGTFIGYQQFLWETPVRLDTGAVLLPDIYLKKKYLDLAEVEIIESRPPISLKKDTTEFSTGYYKTREIAPVEDLLRKLPGVEISSDGNITVNGVPVKEILVDGKPYFENDPKVASRNILAGMIDKVQLIDRKPSSEMGTTGSQSPEKAINLTLKKDRYNHINGLSGAGYGTDGRFASKTSLNRFNTHQQIAVISSANNVNYFDQNIRTNGGYAGRTDWNAGVNYNQDLNAKLALSANYMVVGGHSTILASAVRQNFLKDSSFNYQQNTTTENSATAQVVNVNGKYLIDSGSNLAVQNHISYTMNSSRIESDYVTTTPGADLINSGKTDNQSRSNTLVYQTNWTYTKKFRQPGQVLIAALGYSYNSTPQKSFNKSNTLFHLPDGQPFADSLNQLNDGHSTNTVFQATLNYAQPVFKDRFLDMSYIYTYAGNGTNRTLYGADVAKGTYDQRIDSLSADFRNMTATQYGGLSFRTQKKKFDYSLGVSIVGNQLDNSFVSGQTSLQKKMVNVFPIASLNVEVSKNIRLHFDYNRNIRPPGAEQLLPVPDNSNPLLLRLGNPDLKPASTDYFSMNIRSVNPVSLLTLFFNGRIGLLHHQIVNDLTTDSIGRQISRPVNISGGNFAVFYISGSMPVRALKASINATTSLNLNKDLSINSGVLSQADRMVLRQRIGFNYTQPELLELAALFSTTYNTARYTLQNNSYHYWDYSISLNGNLHLPLGFTLGANLNYTLQTGRAQGYNTDMLIINTEIGKYIFADQQGQIRLQIFDLLDRNISRQRNTGDTFIEDSQTNPLKRFGLLSFTYYFKRKSS